MNNLKNYIDELAKTGTLSDEKLKAIITDGSCDSYLYECADNVRRSVYGNEVYLRGLIEFTNYCKNNCYYCGIRHGNKCAARYPV